MEFLRMMWEIANHPLPLVRVSCMDLTVAAVSVSVGVSVAAAIVGLWAEKPKSELST